MKYFIQLLLVVSTNLCFAQSGNISLKSREGRNCTFIYQPAKGVTHPEGAYVHGVIIQGIETNDNQEILLQKIGENYEFSTNISDTVRVVFFTINEKNKKIIDSNNGLSFIVYIKDKTENDRLVSLGQEMDMIGYAFNQLGLDIADKKVLDKYQSVIQKIPNYQNTIFNIKLFNLKYLQESNSENKEKLFNAALKGFENVKTENELFEYYMVFNELERDDYKIKTEKLASTKFPYSFLAGRYFMNQFNQVENKSDTYILEKWEDFNKRFPKYKNEADQILHHLVYKYLGESNILKLEKVEEKINNEIQVSFIYNDFAWQIAINDTSSLENVNFASQISQKAIEIISRNIKGNLDKEEVLGLEGKKNAYKDTYAYLLNKQGKYEEAFTIENGINDGSTWTYERLAIYGENYKGQMFAKNILEDAIKKSGGTIAMMKQLKNIYEKQNLPLTQFNELFSVFEKQNKQKINDGIIAKFTSLKAPDFTLKNLKGNVVKLEDLKGKVVVVDFWATWCGPCIASMPKMQELANKYKDVEFLFIDTFERGNPAETQKKVEDLIIKKKYNFNVLLDVESAVAKAYKVDYIPNKFIIGKDGKILALDPSEDSMVAIFEENK